MTDLATPHTHVFLGAGHQRNERRTWLVIGLTAIMMIAEITAGTIFGSMALLADGWHMATHAGAMLITAVAYLYARRHAHSTRFTFGTGKVGELAGFASALLLAVVALLIGAESAMRLYSPVHIDFQQAVIVAVIGLTVNLVSAWLLHQDGHEHAHGHHDQDHDHDHHHAKGHAHDHAADNNLRGAYLHVLADALTSVLAIAALLVGALGGWAWLDPAIGVVGALVIARWSFGLLRDTGRVLLDAVPRRGNLADDVRTAMEADGDEVTDLHIWQVGPGHNGVIVSLLSAAPLPLARYRDRLSHLRGISHLTIEVDRKATG